MRVLIQTVRFTSKLSDAEMLETYKTRAPWYRSLSGLVERYYVRFDGPGEHGMLLVWESAEALQAFWESSLARSIASVYQITGAPHIETGSVVMTLESRKRGNKPVSAERVPARATVA